MKHSPAPWRIEGEFDAEVTVTILDAQDNVVFELEPQGPDAWDEPTIANAKLMAAAPELLAELKSMRDRFFKWVRHSSTDAEFALIAVQKADELIAKAEART